MTYTARELERADYYAEASIAFDAELRERGEWIADGLGNVSGRIVRCRDCSKTDTLEDGTLVCTRFGCFNHRTEPDGFCAWGER